MNAISSMILLREKIRDAGLSEFEARIVSTARSSYAFRPASSNREMSKLGGYPNIPQEVPWPTFKEKPMDFICQVDLPPEHLDGKPLLLMLFCDLDEIPYRGESDGAAFSIRYYELGQADDLLRARQNVMNEQYLESFSSIVLPRHLAWAKAGPDFRSLSLSMTALAQYEDLLESLACLDEEKSSVLARLHHHPEHWYESGLHVAMDACGKTMEPNSMEFSRLSQQPSGWTPLLVIPSTKELGLIVGDMENLVIWVSHEAWRNRDVSKARISIEG